MLQLLTTVHTNHNETAYMLSAMNAPEGGAAHVPILLWMP
jgi:hypothetical protein